LNLVSDHYADGLSLVVGGIAFAVVMVLLYRWVSRLGQASTSS
jgi:hypothetical protein